MSLPVFLLLSFALWLGVSLLGLAVWGFAATRLKRPAATSPDPHTVEFPPFGSDPDDDTVRVDSLPPVPPPSRWSAADDAMFAWFAAGRSAR